MLSNCMLQVKMPLIIYKIVFDTLIHIDNNCFRVLNNVFTKF